MKHFEGRFHHGRFDHPMHCHRKPPHGAQTFRRGRALAFLEKLTVKRDTLKQQLDAPEFQEIRQTILGELKALELVINEYIRHFELHESEEKSND